MINKCAFKITEYIKYNSDISNSDDLDKINYVLQVILGELFKIIILILVFSILGRLHYFLFSMIVLISTRIFIGGYHCKTTLRCLLSSAFFFIITSLIVSSFSNVNALVYYGISILSILIIILYAPFPNFKRPVKTEKRRYNLKLISVFSVLTWICILLFKVDNPSYLNCGFSTILLEVLQIFLLGGENK
ncbi:accessory gene regulator B [Clostridium pasteurianum DSM 525 = ATCC 6013]|uniref:Accessory gene regulator B n=1 Tax=Clostridium pasteurianum DSM 525 = ATCC 6013 TaxID=1262449 RepID=A0A0H3J3R8_CLOPA|nr:accessory gene regulator B family protein [Clostridium pasteurianum]AJA48571.1 accessory gene regulator B [Clostridium pasteurianum DSM 525 = ATCC 6013]AJA52559.1 accessory gene regulator B [Clostridium pasteurianum DSM 525 = ATCC 6013]AOZ75803.1 accessory regulator AgrB [Clostridium pasteurianum DSM 525 = ATCC 6013]AOZ79599.1 accessory regulator AgrB [Clostridium pasteurianum]ELP57950.1 putative argB [Clostridium pasteurianum DSM 525 = ATCC 6013]